MFFDEVRVPKSNVLGKIDDGWTVAKYLLEFERGGGAASPALQVMAEEIATVGRRPAGPERWSPARRPRLRAQARRRTDPHRGARDPGVPGAGDAWPRAGNPGTAASMLKVLATELSQALTELAMEAAGPRGRVYQPHATCPGGPVSEYEPPPDGYVSGEPWQAVAPLRYFNDRAGSIYAGSNEIQRNILAKAALGL